MATKKVPNREDTGLGSYELVFIVRPDASEEQFETAVEGVSQFITGRDGVVDEVEQWASRRAEVCAPPHRAAGR